MGKLLAEARKRVAEKRTGRANWLAKLRTSKQPIDQEAAECVQSFIDGHLAANFGTVREFHRWLKEKVPTLMVSECCFSAVIREERHEKEKQ